MPDPNSPVFPNPPQPYFGQGVRNLPQPPDPYDKVEKSSLVTPTIPAPTIGEIKPPVPAEEIKKEIVATLPPLETVNVGPKVSAVASILPIVTKETVPPVPETIPSLEEQITAMISPNPGVGPKTSSQKNDSTPRVVMPPPPAPPNVPYKDSPLDYKFPKKRRFSPWILIIPVILALLGLIVYGVFYFLGSPKPQPLPDASTALILKDESSKNTVSSTSAAPNLSPKPRVPEENSFGTLTPPSFEAFLLNGLSLAGVVVANESTASAVPEKSNVYAFSGDQNLASSSAIFSPEHPNISKSIMQLNPDQFNSQISGQSLYVVEKASQALSDLVSSSKLFGVVERKIDWTKNKLKSLEVTNYYIVHYYPPKSKYWYPVYVFGGNGKLVGEAVNSSGLKMIFFLPAIAN